MFRTENIVTETVQFIFNNLFPLLVTLAAQLTTYTRTFRFHPREFYLITVSASESLEHVQHACSPNLLDIAFI